MQNNNNNIIRKTIAGMLIPLIQLYALYVIAHGEGGPGGGFQGGVILGSSVILFVLIYGVEAGRKRVSEKIGDLFCSCGVLLFAGIGVFCLLAGGNYLEYDMLPLGTSEHASHLGILASR